MIKNLQRNDALARPFSKWVPGDLKVEGKIWRSFESVTLVLKMSIGKNKFQLKLWKVLKQFKTILQSEFANGHLISKSVTHWASSYGRNSSKIALILCALFTILVTLWHKNSSVRGFLSLQYSKSKPSWINDNFLFCS